MIDSGLMQSILDNPDDDLAKEIYADWLEDHGDPTASGWREMVRLGKKPIPIGDGSRWAWYEENEGRVDFSPLWGRTFTLDRRSFSRLRSGSAIQYRNNGIAVFVEQSLEGCLLAGAAALTGVLDAAAVTR